MTVNIDACVKQVMKDKGFSESKATAVCTAAMDLADKGLLLDAGGQVLKATIDDVTGFLTSPVTLARVGVQYYYGFELDLNDRALDRIGVYRPPNEVFHEDSVASFVNLVVTDDHPNGVVSIDNVKSLQVGTVTLNDTPQALGVLTGVVTITDKEEIEKVKSGKTEVSVGYSNDLKQESGVYNNDVYEFIQTNIRANHLAIVDAGRCGPACKITLDNDKKETVMKITIDGIDYDTKNEQLGQAIVKLVKTHDEEKEEMKKDQEEKEKKDQEEKEELKKKADKAEAAKDAALKNVLDEKALDALVGERAELLSTAKEILGDAMPECTDCPKEIKTAVIDKVLDLEIKDWSVKSMDYVNASYDIALTQAKKVKDSLNSLNTDFINKDSVTKDKDGNEITRDSARKGYMEKSLKIVDAN